MALVFEGFCLIPSACLAAETQNASIGESPMAEVAVQIVDQQEIVLKDHSVILNRIEFAPPMIATIPDETVPAAASPSPSSADTRKCETIFCSATVYGHQLTDILCPDPISGKMLRGL